MDFTTKRETNIYAAPKPQNARVMCTICQNIGNISCAKTSITLKRHNVSDLLERLGDQPGFLLFPMYLMSGSGQEYSVMKAPWWSKIFKPFSSLRFLSYLTDQLAAVVPANFRHEAIYLSIETRFGGSIRFRLEWLINMVSRR